MSFMTHLQHFSDKIWILGKISHSTGLNLTLSPCDFATYPGKTQAMIPASDSLAKGGDIFSSCGGQA